ncbi:Lactosylceramide 4-alpha-galactosyltransferase [Pseudolycoriella hygida]|uniref:Lactosylceramide 4-alpha-galactosyltransferase n=1 Tax=Pseudolycoriella hygida TaxID=35572 RepID=A0A9Q0MRJ4_9DIPT|nr:Lactosylceramide 4-alpha-galactosyltransferase [Pseudolycoriella hygida]
MNSALDQSGLKTCYRRRKNGDNHSIKYLVDIMDADKMPVPGESVFFYITSCFESGHIDLKPREACAIESAANRNPNRDIFVSFISPVGYTSSIPKTIQAVLKYPNVHLRNNNMWKYAVGTPLETFLNSDKMFYSNYLYEHISDVLRFLTLFKFGGIYLDTDVVVMKNFDTLGKNFAGDDWGDVVGCSVLGLDATGLGHKIASHCLNEIVENYNGKEFINNGPRILTRTLSHICRTGDRILWTLEQCHGFRLLPINEFFPVPWNDWWWYFNNTFTLRTLRISANSTLIHVWNDRSKNTMVEFGSSTAYELLAEKNCPIVYSTSDSM